MRVLFSHQDDSTLFALEVLSAYYDHDTKELVFAPAEHGFEVVVPGIPCNLADEVIQDLFSTGLYNLSDHPAQFNELQSLDVVLPFY